MSTICLEAPVTVAAASRVQREEPARRDSALVAEYRGALRNRRSVVSELSRENLLQVQAEFSALPEMSGHPDHVYSDQTAPVANIALRALFRWIRAA